MESKKIKKLEKVNRNSSVRFKKTLLKPSRAPTGQIDRPPRLDDESEVHLLESDLFFGVKGEEVFFDISMLNQFKYITSVEVRKDLSEKVVTVLLESKQLYPKSSWSNFSNELDKKEGSSLKEWAASLRVFGSRYEAFLKEFEALRKENNMQKKLFLYKMRQQSAAKRLYILSTYPAFEMRYRMKKDEIKLTELCINETFLKEVGYSLETFTSTVLVEGLPQFFPRKPLAELNTIRSFMDNYMVNDNETPEIDGELYMKTGYRKKVTLQTLTLVELSDSDLILSFVIFLKTKSLPFGSYEKQPYAPEFLEILKEQDKEKEYLFNTYYGENVQGLHSNTEKVCKIKEISFSK